jgi:hypothetical protein
MLGFLQGKVKKKILLTYELFLTVYRFACTRVGGVIQSVPVQSLLTQLQPNVPAASPATRRRRDEETRVCVV